MILAGEAQVFPELGSISREEMCTCVHAALLMHMSTIFEKEKEHEKKTYFNCTRQNNIADTLPLQ